MAASVAVLNALKVAESALTPLAVDGLSLVEAAAVKALHSLLSDLVAKINAKAALPPAA